MFKLKNIGKTKTILYKDGKIKNNVIDWSLNSDNENGMDLNIKMDDDGNKINYHQHLSNAELEDLLKNPVVNKSLEERLMEDFKPYDNNESTLQKPEYFSPQYFSPQPYLEDQTQPQIIIIPTNKTSRKSRPLRKTTRKIRHRVVKMQSKKHKHHHNSSESGSKNSKRKSKKIYICK